MRTSCAKRFQMIPCYKRVNATCTAGVKANRNKPTVHKTMHISNRHHETMKCFGTSMQEQYLPAGGCECDDVEDACRFAQLVLTQSQVTEGERRLHQNVSVRLQPNVQTGQMCMHRRPACAGSAPGHRGRTPPAPECACQIASKIANCANAHASSPSLCCLSARSARANATCTVFLSFALPGIATRKDAER